MLVTVNQRLFRILKRLLYIKDRRIELFCYKFLSAVPEMGIHSFFLY